MSDAPAENRNPPSPTVVAEETSIEGFVHGPGDLVVRGAVHGRIRVGGTVRLEAGCRVEADVIAPRVIIEDGASFRGDVDTTGA